MCVDDIKEESDPHATVDLKSYPTNQYLQVPNAQQAEVLKEKFRMELNSINNSLAAPKENLKLEIPVNHDQNLDL